jgi:iron(II)-dependent oxidoreductase
MSRMPALALALALVAGTASAAAREDMVPMAGGPFVMGSDTGPADERPQHLVGLPGFRIDRLPVTNAQFAEFLDARGPGERLGGLYYDLDDPDGHIRVLGGRYVATGGYANHPAVEVSWHGALAYCRWRGARLPSEAEWERAARGAHGRTFPWGEEAPTPSRARFARLHGSTAPAGANPEGVTEDGVLDLAGNVHEWTSSLYLPYHYNAGDGRENLEVAGERVTRGGAHDSPAGALRAAFRGRGVSRNPERGHHNIGFRCARDGM